MTKSFLALMILLSLTALPASATGPLRDSSVTARFLPSQLPPVRAGLRETFAVIVRGDSNSAQRKVEVTLRVPEGAVVTPESRQILLKPGRDVPVFFKLTFPSDACPASAIAVLIDGRKLAELETDAAYDLESIRWKAAHDKENVGVSQGWMKPEFDDSGWSEKTLPSMWNETGVTYLRAKLFLPLSWRGKDVCLKIRAVDDNDICYVNGVEIGRTNGWDKERSYKIDPGAIRFGDDNLLCIAVDNINAGGGIYRSPNYFGVRFPKEPPKAEVELAPASRIGNPMPFRPMVVKNGVLLYKDGGEVALWGANYYPQSWYQFENMKRLGVDMKKAIRDDLDDMKKMGVQIIRIHVFDREISDRRGNLIGNEHLDLLDYLISEATRRGIYFMFTPIAGGGDLTRTPTASPPIHPKSSCFATTPRYWLRQTTSGTG